MKQRPGSENAAPLFGEEEINAGLLDFIRRSPNGFFAVENIAEELTAAGFSELQEKDAWEIVPGGAYFTPFDGMQYVQRKLQRSVTETLM